MTNYRPDANNLDALVTSGPKLNLPSYVTFPRSVSDMVKVVKYADANNIPISVKTSGHSYTGSSTQKNSILINLNKFPEYTQTPWVNQIELGKDNKVSLKTDKPLPSAVWCDMLEEMTAPCRLAKARNKSATLRIGGGEKWGNVYAAVENVNYYFNKFFNQTVSIVGGGAGTVSAVGGWMQGGGLSIGLERLWGFGVDQVLELEMVLADGSHVKFGPSEWEEVEGFTVPKTTKVTGLCNRNVDEDESKWDWQECEDEKPFADLWHAVRGGGGGSYGIVTAATEQLVPHRQPYFLQPTAEYKALNSQYVNNTNAEVMAAATQYQDDVADFFISVLYNASVVGLSEETSLNCGTPGLMPNINAWGVFVCRDHHATLVLNAFSKYMADKIPDVLAADKAVLTNALELEEARSFGAHDVGGKALMPEVSVVNIYFTMLNVRTT